MSRSQFLKMQRPLGVIVLLHILILIAMAYLSLLVGAGRLPPLALLSVVGLGTLIPGSLNYGRSRSDQRLLPADGRPTDRPNHASGIAPRQAVISWPAGDEQAPLEGSAARAPGAVPVSQQEHSELQPPKAFQDQVRRALSGLKSPPRLAESPLLGLALVSQRLEHAGQQDNRLNRAAALREILIEAIEALRPRAGNCPLTGAAWRFYNVLYYPYVHGLSRKAALAELRRLGQQHRLVGVCEPDELEQVLSWLVDVDENTFYKWQRRASDLIADLLWEENRRLSEVLESYDLVT